MDDEIKGEGNSVNYKYRMHDPRIGRFFAVDPLTGKYPHNSPYAFSENRVVDGVELEGLEVHLLHEDFRAAAFSTGSYSSGIIFDEEGSVGYFKTVTWGGGLVGGYSNGAGYSYYPNANDITQLGGYGLSFGGLLDYVVGGEYTYDMALQGEDNYKTGFSAGAGRGEAAGVFGECSYTWIQKSTWAEVLSMGLISISENNLTQLRNAKSSILENITKLESQMTKLNNQIKINQDQINQINLNSNLTDDEKKSKISTIDNLINTAKYSLKSAEKRAKVDSEALNNIDKMIKAIEED
jgi:hypothetical protein